MKILELAIGRLDIFLVNIDVYVVVMKYDLLFIAFRDGQ